MFSEPSVPDVSRAYGCLPVGGDIRPSPRLPTSYVTLYSTGDVFALDTSVP